MATHLSLIICIFFLSSCVEKPQTRINPPFPHPPAAVGAEIAPRCFPVVVDTGERLNLCPAFKSWSAQLMKYEAQMKEQ